MEELVLRLYEEGVISSVSGSIPVKNSIEKNVNEKLAA